MEQVPEEPKRSNVSNRWQPQGFGSSPQLQKVPKPVVPLPEATGETVEPNEEPTKAVQSPKSYWGTSDTDNTDWMPKSMLLL